MEFGPEIKVDGVKPSWWTGPGPARYRHTSDYWQEYTGHSEWSEADWKYANFIRLPANHPHYATPTPDKRAVAPELVERMRKLVDMCAAWHNSVVTPGYDNRLAEAANEARAIVAALEPVVDEDLVEAREIVARETEARYGDKGLADEYRAGDADAGLTVQAVLAAIKRGRALASRDVTPCTREQFEEDCRI